MPGPESIAIDILIKNALLRTSKGETTDIAITAGKISEIRKGISEKAVEIIDARENLVTESFVNGHLHLDKVYTLEKVGMAALDSYKTGSMGGAMTAIEQAAKVKEQYEESWIIENIRTALDLAVKFGNTHIRAFADTDTKAKLVGVKAVIKAREEYKDKIDVQVVAFPQDGIARDPGLRTIEMLIKRTIREGWEGRVTVIKAGKNITLV